MNGRLFLQAIFKFFMGLVFVGLLLFLPAGTFAFRNAWILIAILLLYIPIIVKRILNEEKVLAEGLPGYPEYMKKVRYRLVPLIW